MNEKCASFLISCCQGKKPTFDYFDIESLDAMSKLRKKSLIDSEGQITLQGAVLILMKMLNLRRLDVLALAYIVSRPKQVSINDFMLVALQFDFSDKDIQNSFGRLYAKEFITSRSHTIYALNEATKISIKSYVSLLYDINTHRDELFPRKAIAC